MYKTVRVFQQDYK